MALTAAQIAHPDLRLGLYGCSSVRQPAQLVRFSARDIDGVPTLPITAQVRFQAD
jgi:hypothetical protein